MKESTIKVVQLLRPSNNRAGLREGVPLSSKFYALKRGEGLGPGALTDPSKRQIDRRGVRRGGDW